MSDFFLGGDTSRFEGDFSSFCVVRTARTGSRTGSGPYCGWTESMSHHLETMGNHCWLALESVSWVAKWISSIHSVARSRPAVLMPTFFIRPLKRTILGADSRCSPATPGSTFPVALDRLVDQLKLVGKSMKWLWGKNRYPKWNPGKWKHGPKPVVPWWFHFDPHPNRPDKHLSTIQTTTCGCAWLGFCEPLMPRPPY